MKCYVCDSESFLERFDLNPKSVVCICKECGNIQHKYNEQEEKKILDFYRTDYRKSPSTINLITTTRKLNYIKPFIEDWFKDKKELYTCDIGCATGYFVNFLRQVGHKAFGTEYTTTYRRFSEHYYGIPITEEIVDKYKYDFISFYHVLEHMMCPDKKLEKYKNHLKDDGVLFISVPNWLFEIEDLSAYGNLCIENYFHENHICCFTENSFRNLMSKLGLEIVKYDTITYGITALIKKGNKKDIVKEDYKEISNKIDVIKKAINLLKNGKSEDAIDLYPKFPDAWAHIIFEKYRKDEDKQASLFQEAEKHIGNSFAFRLARATWHYQFQRYDKALDDYNYCGRYKLDENLLLYMSWCLTFLGQNKEAMNCLAKCGTLNPQKWGEAQEHICKIASSMPTWDEVAREKLKEELLQKHLKEKTSGNKK